MSIRVEVGTSSNDSTLEVTRGTYSIAIVRKESREFEAECLEMEMMVEEALPR
ncbi:MAG: hypothetical protein ABSF83_04540 [Nitrososphaerales archaeon]|jgi:hypothetical protein